MSQRVVRKNPWFAIRKDLSPNRKKWLTLLSFLGPLLTWCLVSYIPFFWHPDIKLTISADRSDVTTVYTYGDHVSKAFFPTFQDAVRRQNEEIVKQRESGADPKGSARFIRRANLKVLRHLAPIAVKKELLTAADKDNDAAIFDLWIKLGQDSQNSDYGFLSDENKEIARENATYLLKSASEYSSKDLPDEPLRSLVPQGISVNPVYLPAPHEVLTSGIRIFSTPMGNDEIPMSSRLKHSLKIVFGGFLISCLFGIPLGILCGSYSVFSKVFEPFIDFFRYMPAPAFSTLLVAIFLAHDAPKIALVFIGTFFQMVLVIANTTRKLDLSLIEAAQTLGAKNKQLLARVTIPGIMPSLYNDLRILLGWAWTWLVIAELIGVKSGLTEFIETQGRWRNFDMVFPVIIMIGVIGFLTDQFLAWFRKYLFPYLNEGQDKKGWMNRLGDWLVEGREDFAKKG